MRTDPPEPLPRLTVEKVLRELPTCEREYLEIPTQTESAEFWTVLGNRQSGRSFSGLSRLDLSRLLWGAVKSRETLKREDGTLWRSRPFPSAGGVHETHVFVVEKQRGEYLVRRYNDVSHALEQLVSVSSNAGRLLHSAAEDVLAVGAGTVLWFAADIASINARYSNPETLVWRNSGALLATLYLVSEALGLSCCGIGATGNPHIQSALNLGSEFIGVGGCVVGGK